MHTVCMIRKAIVGKDCGWYRQHILREFGFGRYKL